ncbi:hypothetical protein, partial [Novosphingobium sp. PhB165]|uniref:hypothetical protein n=1 Tax=Novosphingobium sp. PhB165 TaxID=2485105 RepID=UPI001A9EE7F5
MEAPLQSHPNARLVGHVLLFAFFRIPGFETVNIGSPWMVREIALHGHWGSNTVIAPLSGAQKEARPAWKADRVRRKLANCGGLPWAALSG